MRACGKERTPERLMCGNRFNNVRRWNTKMVRSVCSRAITILCQVSVCIRNAMRTLRPKKYEDKQMCVAFRRIYLTLKTQLSQTRRGKLSWLRMSLSICLTLSCASISHPVSSYLKKQIKNTSFRAMSSTDLLFKNGGKGVVFLLLSLWLISVFC